uniref:Uncharacterized protein n=1 Tax=Rhizophora mucronata TaxID=61149 RepID=A0A2P2R4X8_RHIMU
MHTRILLFMILSCLLIMPLTHDAIGYGFCS